MMEFSHLDQQGKPQMVDVSSKNATYRYAKAQAIVVLPRPLHDLIHQNDLITKKGSVFQTAILAGIMASKRTSELIPLCHLLAIEKCEVHIQSNDFQELIIQTEVSTTGKTGVEMEALTAASVAALTIYDMCKAFSQEIVIKEIKLLEKTGGKTSYQATS